MCFIALFLVGCGCDTIKPADDPNSVLKSQIITPSVIDYGNGVLFFNYAEGDFGNALSAYLKEHPEKEVTAIVGGKIGAHGYIMGYFVTVRDKNNSER
jgi:hypothetical protein